MDVLIKDVSFYYSKEKELIQDCNLHIQSGEVLALLGPSGCGKSTLLKLILGIHEPIKGEILIDGESNYDRSLIAAHLSEERVYPWMTLEENLRLVGSKEESRNCLKEIGMIDWADYYPTAISAGMKKKLYMARISMLHAGIWLLDEPFNGLDLNSKQVVQEFLKKKKQGKTILMVTHNPQEATSFADRVIFWDKNKKRPEQEWVNHSDKNELLDYMLHNALGMEE